MKRVSMNNNKEYYAKIRKLVVESFTVYPWLNGKERAKLIGVGQKFVARVVAANQDALDLARLRDVRKRALEMPNPTTSKIAELVGIKTPRPVGEVLLRHDKELYNALLHNQRREAYFAKRGKAVQKRHEIDQELVAKVARELKARPFVSGFRLAVEMKVKRPILIAAFKRLAEVEKFDRHLEREIALAEFIEQFPGAGVDDAAEYFQTVQSAIIRTRGSWLLRPPREPVADVNSAVDAEMEKNCCMRPAWYVEEVCERGGLGVELPEPEFNRYLALYEARRNGKKLYTIGADNRIHGRNK